MSDAARIASMLEAEGLPHAECRGRVFVRDRHRIVPHAPLLRDVELTAAEADALLARLGGWWVQWTTSADAAAAARGWYAVICRTFTPVESIESSNVRSKLRRGLKRCGVERVTLDAFIEKAFEIHDAAVSDYERSAVSRLDRAAFQAALERERGFDDLRHYWLVTIDGAPAAYAKNLLHDRIEVDYTAVKFHPEHLKHYTSYALLHEMNRHYLAESGFEYASDGQRSIHHDTSFQEFLIRDLGFEAHPLALRVRYARRLAMGLRLARPLRAPLSRRNRNAAALFALDRFAEPL